MAAGVLLLAIFVYEQVVDGPLRWITGWIVYPVLLFMAACVVSKRLHDRGKSGWWAALVLFGFIVVWPEPDGFFDFLGVIALVWAAVELAVLMGEEGANRYGPNPLKSGAAGQSDWGGGSPDEPVL
jgi:uncharacterized membrane protein YhaH (DUF805 family)